MKTFNLDHLPDDITHNNRLYTLDISRSHLHASNAPLDKRGCVLLKVMHKNHRGKTDLHGQPYKPTEWIFYSAEAAKTPKAYEEYLNKFYADTIKDYLHAQRDFGRWAESISPIATAKQKQHALYCHPLIVRHYNRQSLGSFVRKYGPNEFNSGYNEWQPQ